MTGPPTEDLGWFCVKCGWRMIATPPVATVDDTLRRGVCRQENAARVFKYRPKYDQVTMDGLLVDVADVATGEPESGPGFAKFTSKDTPEVIEHKMADAFAPVHAARKALKALDGPTLKEQGMAVAASTQDKIDSGAWMARAHKAIHDLAIATTKTGMPFSAEAVAVLAGRPSRPNAMGACISAAARAGIIVAAGVAKANRPERHANMMRMWKAGWKNCEPGMNCAYEGAEDESSHIVFTGDEYKRQP